MSPSPRLPAAPVELHTARRAVVSHAHDAWPISVKQARLGRHPHCPDAVAYVRDEGEVSAVLAWAGRAGVAVTPWGLGSSVTGAPLAIAGGVSLDLSGLDSIGELDEINLTVQVQPGVRGDVLEKWLGHRGYTLNHSPQSLDRSSVGGWVSTLATGQFSTRYGGIEHLVAAMRVVLPTGEVVEFPNYPRAAVGPDLRHLFIGAEGTLGVVTSVTLKVFPTPEARLVTTLRFDSVDAVLDAMRLMMRRELRPFLLRGYDHTESRHAMGDDSFAGCAMFLGAQGSEVMARAELNECLGIALELGARDLGPAGAEAWMARRYDFSTIEARLARAGGFAETIEVAAPWDAIGLIYQEAAARMGPLADEVLAHFSHAYPQGTSLYLIALGQAVDDQAAIERIEECWRIVMEVTARHGGALSHHHGAGLARLPYLPDDAGRRLLGAIKAALDARGTLCPGKLGICPAGLSGRGEVVSP